MIVSSNYELSVSIKALQETIRQQQAEIDRLTEQRDRLLKALKDTAVNEELLKGSGQGFIKALDDARSLIAEIEASK